MQFIHKAQSAISLLVLLALTACSFSTAADITPPPGSQVEPPATQIPTLASTPTAVAEEVSPAQTSETEAESEPADEGEEVVNSITFSGKVVNLSGGTTPTDLQVVLQGFEGMNLIMTQTTEIKADGTFAFQPLESIAELIFIATVEYEGLLFASDIIRPGDVQPGDTAEFTIPIYDKTDGTNELYADRAHIFLEVLSENRVQVVEYLLISNPTNLVIAGATPEEPVLSFTLPEGAANLQFEDSDMSARFISLDGGFGDMLSIRPGMQQHEILFAYELPYDGNLSLELVFPVKILSGTLIIPEGIKLKSDQVTESEPQELEMGLMQIFNMRELPKDSPLKMVISGKLGTTAAGATTNNKTGLAIGLGTFAVVLILSGLWLSRKPKQTEEPALEEPEDETEEGILDKIIELDQAFESGNLQQDEYTRQRSELKEKLREIHSQ